MVRFISGYQQDYWQEDGYERTLSAGWNGNIDGISYSVTRSYSDYPDSTQPADQQLAFNIRCRSATLCRMLASYSVNTAKHGDTRQQVGLNGTTLADNPELQPPAELHQPRRGWLRQYQRRL